MIPPVLQEDKLSQSQNKVADQPEMSFISEEILLETQLSGMLI